MPESRLRARLPWAVAALLLAACSTPAPAPPGPTAASDPPLGRVDELADLVPRQLSADGVLTIGTDPSYPPMEFIGESGSTVEGADIDLAGAVATVLGMRAQFENEAFSALPTSVRTGRVEMAASSLTISRRSPIDTNAVLYFRSGSQLVAGNSGPGLTMATLCGRTIAVLEGSVQVRALAARSRSCRTDGRPPLRIEARSDSEQVTTAVLSGRAVGLFTDTPVARFSIAQHPRQLSAAGPAVNPAFFGMITPPEYPRFAKAVAGAVQHLIDTGYYAAVLARWDVSEGAIARARIRWSRSTVVERKARAAARQARRESRQ